MPDDPTVETPHPEDRPTSPEAPRSPNRPSREPEIGDPGRSAGPETPGKPGKSDGGPEAPVPPRPGQTPDGGRPQEGPAGTADADQEAAGEDPRIAELQSLVVHLKADFDNYRKRSQKEISSASRSGELDAVRRFLPIIANLERALAVAAAAPDAGEGSSAAVVDGVRQIYEQFQSTLKGMGVERIQSAGRPFDPSLHDAVAATARADVAPGTVTDEFEPGYSADGRALVPAKVRVSTAE